MYVYVIQSGTAWSIIFLYVILFAFMYVCGIKSMTYLCSALGVSAS